MDDELRSHQLDGVAADLVVRHLVTRSICIATEYISLDVRRAHVPDPTLVG